MRIALDPDAVRRVLDPSTLPFATTEEVARLDGLAGQPRVMEALDLALGTRAAGYNVFATGPRGTPMLQKLEGELRIRAATQPALPDAGRVRVRPAGRRPPGRPADLRAPAAGTTGALVHIAFPTEGAPARQLSRVTSEVTDRC